MKKTFLFLSLALLVSLTACNRFNDDLDELQASQDNADVQAEFEDVYRMVDEETQSADDLRDPCRPTVTRDTTAGTYFPVTVTYDFGAGCTGADGRTRSGQIIVTHTGRYRDAGSVMTVLPVNYVVDGRAIEGTKTVTNNGRNGQGNLSYTVAIAQGEVTFPDGTSRTLNATWTREWIAGEGTTVHDLGVAGLLDDVWLISGSATGTRRGGQIWSAVITTPLRRELSCQNIVSGVVEISPDGRATRTLDYGNGDCDRIATMTVNGNTRTIMLRGQ